MWSLLIKQIDSECINEQASKFIRSTTQDTARVDNMKMNMDEVKANHASLLTEPTLFIRKIDDKVSSDTFVAVDFALAQRFAVVNFVSCAPLHFQ